MTTKNFGMMVIGMMLIGTTTVFGKTNTTVHNNRHGNTRTEVVVVNTHNGCMDKMHNHREMVRHMDRNTVDHILNGRHVFNRFGECKVCHLNRHEIINVERELRSVNRPVVTPNRFAR